MIENIVEDQEVRTNLDEIINQVKILGAENILCILSTSSCFAARGMDKLYEIG